MDWDSYFINIADNVAKRSKDPSTQVWAVIVDKRHRPISFWYNWFLWAWDDRYLTWERPMKYYFSIHAEMNAILFSKTDLNWCTLYCNYACCENCLKFIIQSWIKSVVYKQLHVKSFTNSSEWSMEHPETWEAATLPLWRAPQWRRNLPLRRRQCGRQATIPSNMKTLWTWPLRRYRR